MYNIDRKKGGKINLDTDDPEDVATFDEDKAEELRTIYRDMNEAAIRSESETREVTKHETDEKGNIKEVTESVTLVYATVVRSKMAAAEMADTYGFSTQQKEMLRELLDEGAAELWQGLLTPAA